MKKKTVIIIVIAGVVGWLFIAGMVGLFLFGLGSSSTENVKEITVGDYTLKLGRYKPEENDDGEGSILILSEDYFEFEGEDEQYEYEIKGNELLYNGYPFFLVTGNDKLELEAGGGVKYAYAGEEKAEKTTKTKKEEVKITELEATYLELENYSSSEFTMKIPKGWKVSKGGNGVHFGIRVYDPNDDRNQIFYIIKMEPFYKSQNAINMYKLSLGSSFDGVVMSDPSTENFFRVFNDYTTLQYQFNNSGTSSYYLGYDFPYISNLDVIESYEGNSVLHNNAIDDKILRATFNSGSATNDGEAEGLFSACIVEFGQLGYGNDQFSYYMAYDISGITAAKDELINYEEILLSCLRSIKFTSSYTSSTIEQINQQTQVALNLSKQLSQACQSYNDAWTNRQKTYDIMSQKQSDATLGYERVYDTETGEIYKAYNGFTDSYSGNRYKAISDEQYTEKVTGYIEK